MAMENGEIGWFSPDPRGIIPIRDFHIPHGLRRALRKGSWELVVNAQFSKTLRNCADREETWINGEIFATYQALHEEGFAHALESYCNGARAGGLYGVAIGGAFFGESMFHCLTDGSKVALLGLALLLELGGFTLLDAQWNTSHLAQFGAMEIPKKDYLQRLKRAIHSDSSFPEPGSRFALREENGKIELFSSHLK